MASLAIDPKAYGKLLAKTVPSVIDTDEEHAHAMETVTALALKGNSAAPEETALLRLLGTLIADYERKRWPMRVANLSPGDTLAFLMEENGLKQTDLSDIAPQSNISAMLSGKRPIGKTTALKLGKRFKVSPALFL